MNSAPGPGTAHAATTSNTVSGGTLHGALVQASSVSGGVHVHHVAAQPPALPAPRQLPRAVPYFTNRCAEQAALDTARARGTDVVVLSGVAGVGTSALATQWLHAQEASAEIQLYADLTHTAELPPEAVLQSWLRALGIGHAPAQRAEAVGLWRSVTAGRAVHVLIDGVVDAEQVRPLIPSGLHSFTVVTSRKLLWALSVDGALLLPVNPLSRRDAVRLLCAVAGAPEAADDSAARPGAESLAEACAHLPLPLVLTGARLRARPGRPFAPVRSSGTSPNLLQEHARMALMSALDASYADLESDAQRLYRTLGVLPALTVDADLAAAVCELPPAAAGWYLEVLADERLLDPEPGDCPDPRYRMNGAARDHARAKALEADTTRQCEGALMRLCDRLLDYSRRAQRVLTPAQATLLNPAPVSDGFFEDESAALAWLDGQEVNFLPVLEATESAGWDERVVGLVDAWWPFFTYRHRYYLWITSHEIGVAAARRGQNEAVVRQMLASGAIGLSADGQLLRAIHWYEQVTQSALAAGDVRDEGQALLGLGACHLEAGEPGPAREHLDAAMSLWEACGYHRGVGLAEITLGEVCLAENDPDAAKHLLASAHRRLSGLAEPYEAARALALHGHARVRCGQSTEAIAELERALDAVGRSTRWKARTLEWLGDAHHHRGDTATARTCWGEAADLFESISRSPDAARLRARAAER